MAWRVAASLQTLLGQLNAMAPGRSKASDGSIGDPAHSSRTSDHNPDPAGVVRARDFTHDPGGGLDCQWLAAQLAASRDRRIKYVIWNHRILSGAAGPAPWVWRTYTGTNPHTRHLHLSVVTGAAADTVTPWDLGGPLMALSDQQQHELYAAVDATHRRVLDVLRQRYYELDQFGVAHEVAAGTSAATKPAAVLDTLDGNYLIRRIAALEEKAAPVELTDAQLDVLADKVAARLGTLRFDAAKPEGSR